MQGEVDGLHLILPDGNGDCREPFMERVGGVGVLGEERVDLVVDGRFPVGMEGGIEEHPASWGCGRKSGQLSLRGWGWEVCEATYH